MKMAGLSEYIWWIGVLLGHFVSGFRVNLAMYIMLVGVPVFGTYVMFPALIWFMGFIFILFEKRFMINRLSNILASYGCVLLPLQC